MADLHDLPPELLRNVFAFKGDLKELCLVNWTFHKLAAPFLWEKFTTNLRYDSEGKELADLVQSGSNVLPLIKEIDLDFGSEGPPFVSDGLQNGLLMLVSAMPRDQLKRLTSTAFMSTDTFSMVSQIQRCLECVDVGVICNLGGSGDPRVQIFRSSSYLRNLTHAHVYIRDGSDTYTLFDVHRPFWHGIAHLKHLTLAGEMDLGLHAKVNDMHLNRISAGEMRSYLKSLNLTEFGLRNCYNGLSYHVHFMELQSLTLVNCDDPQPLLFSIAKNFRIGRSALQYLKVRVDHEPNELSIDLGPSLSTLLASFAGLKHLRISTQGRMPLVPVTSIVAHAATLQCLHISVLDFDLWPLEYEEKEPRTIISKCVRLEELALDIGIARMDKWQRIRHDIFATPEGEEEGYYPSCEAILRDIAPHPNLHTLRISDPPFIAHWRMSEFRNHLDISEVPDPYVDIAAEIINGIVTQALQYLCTRGSQIRTIGWSPSKPEPRSCSRDFNGHRWPEYVYRKEIILDGQGRETVSAKPLRNFEEELAHGNIFTNI